MSLGTTTKEKAREMMLGNIPPLGWFARLFRSIAALQLLAIAVYVGWLAWNVGILNFPVVLDLIAVLQFGYLGFSTLLQVILRLRGCEAAVIPHLLFGKPMYRCAPFTHELDELELRKGATLSLLFTRPSILHIIGVLLLSSLIYGLLTGLVPLGAMGVSAILLFALGRYWRYSVKRRYGG